MHPSEKSFKAHERPFHWLHASRIFPVLALCLCLSGHSLAQEPGMLPSLDGELTETPSGITPISELTNIPDVPPEKPKPAKADLKPAVLVTQLELQPLVPILEIKPEIEMKEVPAIQPETLPEKAIRPEEAKPTPQEEPQLRLEPQAEIPAVEAKPAKSKFSFANLGLTNPFEKEKAMQPISYSALPGIAIFPVIKHGNETAFSDLPLVFAREYAIRMEQRIPETKVYNPVYTVDELRIKGLGHVYDQVMKYYLKAGRPEPTAIDYLLKQISAEGQAISRVIFVEADLDFGNPEAATGLIEMAKNLLTDDIPKHMKYLVHSRLQIFDAEKPDFPMVWAGSWNRTIKQNQISNVTPSVFADSDSLQTFSGLSRQMSRELLYVTPKAAYMAPQYDLQVQGSLVTGKEQPFPNFTEVKQPRNPLSNENKQAIQRILQNQGGISP